MLNWLSSHAQLVGAAINLCMLVVWIVYLQVFVSSYHRQVRSKILISLSGGRGLDARCLVSNMSSQAIYVESIIIDLETEDERKSFPITELLDYEQWDQPSDLNLWSRQGPLGAAQVRDMGSFRKMLSHALGEARGWPGSVGDDEFAKVQALDVRVVAAYGSEDLPIGAVRRFEIRREDGRTRLRPQSSETGQIRSRRARREIRRLLDEELE